MDTGSPLSLSERLPDLPQRPPLEVLEQSQVWLVRAYRPGAADGTVFSTHDDQIDAVRATKAKMQGDAHPCALRWDSPRSVGNLYWDPRFERLDVRYDDLLGAWTVVPAAGTCAIAGADSRDAACELAKQVQYDYDFKHLRAYGKSDDEFEERDHRFLRHDITDSGVRFDPSALDPPSASTDPPDVDDGSDGTDDDADRYVTPASPGQLGASVPDVTKVEFVDTDGVLHRYATPWGDGTSAEIIAVSQKFATHEQVREAFDAWLSRWRAVEEQPTVATVYESGTDPVPWVAYQAGDYTLATVGRDLPADRRLPVLEQVCAGVDAVARDGDEPVCGVHPKSVHVHAGGPEERAAVAQFGIEWAVQRAVGAETPTAFTAPEQLDGHLTRATTVYQVGAVAYVLLCESPPVQPDRDVTTVVRAGEIPPAQPVDGVPDGVGPVVDRALEPAPADRYDSVTAFSRALRRVA